MDFTEVKFDSKTLSRAIGNSEEFSYLLKLYGVNLIFFPPKTLAKTTQIRFTVLYSA